MHFRRMSLKPEVTRWTLRLFCILLPGLGFGHQTMYEPGGSEPFPIPGWLLLGSAMAMLCYSRCNNFVGLFLQHCRLACHCVEHNIGQVSGPKNFNLIFDTREIIKREGSGDLHRGASLLCMLPMLPLRNFPPP